LVLSQTFYKGLISEILASIFQELYNYLAAQLVKFISSSSGSSGMPGAKPREIGVTFSFPVVNSAAHGIHVEWNRGFSIKESVSFIRSISYLMIKVLFHAYSFS